MIKTFSEYRFSSFTVSDNEWNKLLEHHDNKDIKLDKYLQNKYNDNEDVLEELSFIMTTVLGVCQLYESVDIPKETLKKIIIKHIEESF